MKVPHGEISRYTRFDISIKENKAFQCKMKHMKEGQHCYLSIKLVLQKGWGEGPQGLPYQLLMLNWVSISKFDLTKEITGHSLVTHDWYHRLKNNKGSDSLLIFHLFGCILSWCKSAEPVDIGAVTPFVICWKVSTKQWSTFVKSGLKKN